MNESLKNKIKILRKLELAQSNRPFFKRPKMVLNPKKIKVYNGAGFSVFNDDVPEHYWYWLILFLPFWYLTIVVEFLFSIIEIKLAYKLLSFFLIILSLKFIQYIYRYLNHRKKLETVEKDKLKYEKEKQLYSQYLKENKSYEKEEKINHDLNLKISSLKQEIINDFISELKTSDDFLLNGELAKKYEIQDILTHYIKMNSNKSRAEKYKKYKEEITDKKLNEISLKKRQKSLLDIQNFYEKEVLQVTKREDLNDEEKVKKIINIYCVICASVAIQPIPFADIFILSPIQVIMGKRIAEIREYNILNNGIENILKEITGTIGLGLLAQQITLGAYKTIIPFYGAITTIPMVYGLTYGIGRVMDYYILEKVNNNSPDKEEMKRLYKSSKKYGEKIGNLKQNEIENKN